MVAASRRTTSGSASSAFAASPSCFSTNAATMLASLRANCRRMSARIGARPRVMAIPSNANAARIANPAVHGDCVRNLFIGPRF